MKDNIREIWLNLTEFKKDSDGEPIIPPIPKCSEEEYNTIVIPALLRCGAIPKDQLVVGETYYGDCRNSSVAIWNGRQFVYERDKFGYKFEETINHFQDDDGYDLFVPLRINKCTKKEETI